MCSNSTYSNSALLAKHSGGGILRSLSSSYHKITSLQHCPILLICPLRTRNGPGLNYPLASHPTTDALHFEPTVKAEYINKKISTHILLTFNTFKL